jgi:plastocyanin/mono/diheme cytochrome c family protein
VRARSFLLGVVVALAAQAVVAALVVWSGVVDVAATTTRALPDRVLDYAATRAIAHHAPPGPNPLQGDPAALRKGLEHYREMCVECHGGPGVTPEELAAGLHPPPPDLASAKIQAFTDGMIYDTVARGIGSTGMPAFGKTHRPEQIWSIVAFVRHLPQLTPEERRELARGAAGVAQEHAEHDHEHGEEHGDEHAAAEAPPDAGARVHEVSIAGFKFVPATLEVQEGDVVEWKNADLVAHTATADDESFDTGRLDGGQAKRVVVRKKGRFPYTCAYHMGMKGTLVVR